VGKVVWWGRDLFHRGTYSQYTNGVVDFHGEVLQDAIAIAAGESEPLVLRSNGTVAEYGFSDASWDAVPADLDNVVAIAGAGGACWAIRRDGSLVRWGNGDPGDNDLVANLRDVKAVAWAGDYRYLAIKHDGTVIRWEVSNYLMPDGQAPEPVARPVSAHGQVLSNAVALVSGFEPLALMRDGTVLWLGPRSLEDNPEADSHRKVFNYPYAKRVAVGEQVLSNVTAIAGGGDYHLALKNDGIVVAWHGNDKPQPAPPVGLSNVTAIAMAGSLCLVLRKNGTVVAWGDNSLGQTSVPIGLSNVVAIAAGGEFGLALTTGNIPPSVYIEPHGRLEQMEREADLIFKGQVLSTRAATNTSFPEWGKPHATRFRTISLLKGSVRTNELVFWHNTGEPGAWSGGRPPSAHQFVAGNSYLVFAAGLDKPDYLYSVPADATNRPNQLRQLCHDGVMRTLDARQVGAGSVKDAHWAELGSLLHDAEATNQLYAIDLLDRMSLAGRRDDDWRRSDDFKRRAVLAALLPLVTNRNERVASRAIGCFAAESNAKTALEPFAAALIKVATDGPSASLRLNAISALSGTHFESVSNSLVQLLHDSGGNVRSRAVALLASCPADFSERALHTCAADDSPKVRAGVADVIGGRTMENLLPTLVKLFADPVGRQQPVAPLTLEELEGGGKIVGTEGGVTMVDEPNYPGANVGDVHTSAGYALLKFDIGLVGEILKTNLNDAGFRLQFLLKLAESDPKPWIGDMVEIMEARRARNLKKAEANHAPPGAYMYLSGAHWQCWKTIYAYLENLPATEFGNGKQDRYLQVLEQAGNTGSQEPVMLYELYKAKGLNRRASQFRAQNGNYSGYDLNEFFKRIDAKYATNAVNSSQ
jgi:hypothetical protein